MLHDALSHNDIVVQMSYFSAPNKGRCWQLREDSSQLIQAPLRDSMSRVMNIDDVRERERDSSCLYSPGGSTVSKTDHCSSHILVSFARCQGYEQAIPGWIWCLIRS